MLARAKDLLLRYGLSLLGFFLAFLLTRLLWPYIQPSPVPLFFAAIIAAFFGGFGPGAFVSVIAALTIDYAFVPPYNHVEWSAANLVRMGVFITVSALVSWLNSKRKHLTDERGNLLKQIEGFNEDLRKEVLAATQELGQVNEALLKTQQHLARSERLAVVGQMAASLAHEVGTPLNAISGHLELLADTHSSDTDTRRRIRIIRQQLDFIVGTVKRLLEWTHKRNIAFKPLDIEKLIREVLWLVRPTLDEHSITSKVIIQDQFPTIDGDRESLQQVLLNLINNSIDAMPKGGEIEISAIADTSAGTVEIVFRDTGVGLEPNAIEHLFEPMWTTKPTGGGFGLAIAREVMNDHRGEIQVINDQPIGTSFRLTMPIAQPRIKLAHEKVMSNVA